MIPWFRAIRSLGWLGIFLGLFSTVAQAHEMSMAEMEVRELSPGEFLWRWSAVNDKSPSTAALQPQWPASCLAEANRLHCGDPGLRGTLAVDGIGNGYSAALIKIFWLDGQSRVYTITAGQPTVRLYGGPDDRRSMSEITSVYTVLGIEHILSGYDHLLFVLSLLFLVGFNRRLVVTITAFTVAHSVTLALSALDLLTLRPPPVEATIALSIMLVAGEALHDKPTQKLTPKLTQKLTLARRWPALVAFLFGLVHGLGFAGALQEIGLPQNHLPVALLTFNVGVELGQLLVVGLTYAVYRALAKRPRFVAARVPALYAIGSLAAYWSIGRIVGIVT